MAGAIGVALLPGAGARAATPYLRYQEKGFTLVFQPGHERQARQLAGDLQGHFIRLTRSWAAGFNNPITVLLAASQEEFNTLTRNGVPDWGAGCAFPAQSTMVLKAKDHPWSQAGTGEIAIHELSHIMLYGVAAGQPVPRWFDEGLAMYESREWRWGQTLVLARAVLTNSVIPLAAVDRVLAFQDSKAKLAYAESYCAFYFLLEKEGKDKIDALIQRLAGMGFEQAFAVTFGYGVARFNQLFSAYLPDQYHWTVLLQETSLFWISLVGLFLLVYAIKKYRTRKVVRQWEEQERMSYVQ